MIADFRTALVLGLFACAGLSACGHGSKTLSAAAVEKIDVPTCKGPNEVPVDLNGDGRADVVHVMQNGERLCSRFDFNFDGIVDMIRVYSDGTHKKLEAFDHDRDGRPDEVINYRDDGSVESIRLDMDFDRKLDAQFHCAAGFVQDAERARNHEGRIDTWETYNDGLLVEAKYSDDGDDRPERFERYEQGVLVSIDRDTDRDGKPDLIDPIASIERRPAQAPLRCELQAVEQNVKDAEKAAQSAATPSGEAPKSPPKTQ